MNFNSNFLNYKPIFTQEETKKLESINQTLSLEAFLDNKNLIEKFGFDFVYTSAKIEGNTYSKADALTLLEYGRTSGGKSYSDAKMLLNLQKAFKFILTDDCVINKHKIRTIHHILASDLVEDSDLGVVRQKGVLIKGSDYIPASDALTLESQMDKILDTAQTIDNPYDKALYLHNNLAYLQYFVDVNKRTARTMLNLSLICDGKMLLIPQEALISTYIEGVLEYYENGTASKSKEFFIKSYQAMEAQAKEIGYGKK
jgi:Fic family protein